MTKRHPRKTRQEVLPDRPAEQNRVLRDDGQFAAQIGQSDVADVDAVDQDGASGALHQPEQGNTQRRLPCRTKPLISKHDLWVQFLCLTVPNTLPT